MDISTVIQKLTNASVYIESKWSAFGPYARCVRSSHQAVHKLESNNIDPFYIDISISTNLRASDFLGLGEPDNSIIQYDVEFNIVDESENKVAIGDACCYFFTGYDWVNDAFNNLREMADAHSGELLEGVMPVINNDGALLDKYLGFNVLYISRFYINSEYRGKGIGQIVFPLVLNVLGQSAHVVTVIPVPTENGGNTRIDSNDPRHKSMLNRMTKFIKSFGFVKANRKSRVWVKDMSLKD